MFCAQINGTEMAHARHEQAVSLLTGHERFVRLVVERETPVIPQNSSKFIHIHLYPPKLIKHVIYQNGLKSLEQMSNGKDVLFLLVFIWKVF